MALFQIWVPASVAAAACGLAAGCTVTAAPVAAERPAAGAPFVYVTGKGGPNEIGQYASLGSGALRPLTPKHVASGEFPYDIAVSPQGTSAYAVDNLSGTAGAVSQYTLNPATGKLTPKSPRTVAVAGSPSGIIAISPDGQNAYVPTARAISQFRISPGSGALSARPVQTVATGPNPQMITVAPDGRSAYVTGTGDSRIWQYTISPATGRLTPKSPATVATGRAPHDLAVSPDGKNLYVVTSGDDTITQYAISPATGALSSRPVSAARTVPVPEAIALSPDGRNAYVTSEHRRVLSQFAISPVTGKITALSPATVTAPPDGSLGVAVTPAR